MTTGDALKVQLLLPVLVVPQLRLAAPDTAMDHAQLAVVAPLLPLQLHLPCAQVQGAHVLIIRPLLTAPQLLSHTTSFLLQPQVVVVLELIPLLLLAAPLLVVLVALVFTLSWDNGPSMTVRFGL